MEGMPLASFPAQTMDRIPWSEWAFMGPDRITDPQGLHWAGQAIFGFGLWHSHQ